MNETIDLNKLSQDLEPAADVSLEKNAEEVIAARLEAVTPEPVNPTPAVNMAAPATKKPEGPVTYHIFHSGQKAMHMHLPDGREFDFQPA